MSSETSNRLPVLAAEIRRAHDAVATALKDSLQHALAAGDALIEAKAALAHGQWLPWLKDHCAISERTAQLYMRVAKNRAEIEEEGRWFLICNKDKNEGWVSSLYLRRV